MLLPHFKFHNPATVSEAVSVLSELGDKAAVLAGGTDLLVNMKHKNIAPENIVALSAVEGLADLDSSGGALKVGPMLTAAALAANGTVKKMAGALGLGGAVLGSPQVRNRATVGGNVCNARPAADMCVGLMACGAKAVLAGPSGERQVDLVDFFTGPGATVKAKDEILIALLIEDPGEGAGFGYEKLGLRKALEIALVNVGASLVLDGDGKTIKAAKVALGAVGPTPLMAPAAAAVLVGQAADEALFAKAGEAAGGDAKPIDDHRGSAWYRREMVAVLTRRALSTAFKQAQGK